MINRQMIGRQMTDRQMMYIKGQMIGLIVRCYR